MLEGGLTNKLRSTQIFRYAGFLIPAILIIYGALIQTQIISFQHMTDSFGLLAFSFWLLVIGVIQFLFESKSTFDSILRLIAYHLLIGGYIVFVSGMTSPILICWVLLTLVSYIYFSKLGFVFSNVTLTLFVLIDAYIYRSSLDISMLYNMLILVSIVITCTAILFVFNFQETSKKELSQIKAHELLQRDRVLTIINNLANAVLSVDINGIIRVYNAASLGLLDTNIDLNGKHIDNILKLTNKDGEKVSIYKLLQSINYVIKRDDLNYLYNKDDVIRLEITMSPIRSSYSRSKKSSSFDGYILIMSDVTKAKSLEEERDEFISVVSHELRTPITVVEGTLSNMQVMLEHPDVTNSMVRDNVKTAHEQIMFLAGMVNDLSALSRAERGVSDDEEEIDVQELAHALMNKYSDEVKAKKIHLNLDLSPKLNHVLASRLYLEELLQNFITNAIKYTKKGSITISFKQNKDKITFSVKDTGIGISKSDQTKIFNKFYRSEDYRTRESNGTGLGLYIAIKLSHKLGTKINLTSRLNFGSTFSFTLPIKKH